MPTPLIDNFELKTNKPIDNRFVVGQNSFYLNKEDITNKYIGLRVWDTNVSISFYWDGTSWVEENQSSGIVDGVNGRLALFTSTDQVNESIIREDSGKIGIGETPVNGYSLTVNGSVLLRGDDLYIGRSIRHLGNPSCYISYPSNDTISLTTSNSQRIRILPNGNVGINTSSPSDRFYVEGNISSNQNTNSKIGFNTPDHFTTVVNNDTINIAHYGLTRGNTNSGTYLSGYFGLNFVTNGGQRVKIDDNGNVGIGTDNPFEKLDVFGTVKSINSESTKGYYSMIGPNTADTNSGKWIKVFRFRYTSFTTNNFTLKINASGDSSNNAINSDIHISFKAQNSLEYIYANICNYGESVIRPNKEFEIIREEESNNTGFVYIYHKINTFYTRPTYTILGNINSDLVKYLNFEGTTLQSGNAWIDKSIICSTSSKPSQGEMGLVPIRTIVMFSGTDSQVPSGWRLCNANVVINGIFVPDLSDKFIIGRSNQYPGGSIGGFTEPTLPRHNHSMGNGGIHRHDFKNYYYIESFETQNDTLSGWDSLRVGTGFAGSNSTDYNNEYIWYRNDKTDYDGSHTHNIDFEGEINLTNKNLPPYYALAYIIYVGVG